MRLAIAGPRECKTQTAVRRVLRAAHAAYGDTLIVMGLGGSEGVGATVRAVCVREAPLSGSVAYEEHIPSHMDRRPHCPDTEEGYGAEYDGLNHARRNARVARLADRLVLVVRRGSAGRDGDMLGRMFTDLGKEPLEVPS